jgi:disulfide bond formation protein DsbB
MSARSWALAIALACIGAVAGALVSQHVYDMQPCPWCILQRLIFVVIGGLALLAALLGGVLRMLLGTLMLLLALAGAAAALYQNLVASKSQSCNLTLADRIVSGLGLDTALPPVFQVTASCADAAVKLAGVPYEFWSLALYVLIGLAALLVTIGARR